MFDSLRPHGLQPTRLLHPWDFPGKDTAVGCHFLLQGIFPTQGSNPGLLQCRQILYRLSYKLSQKTQPKALEWEKEGLGNSNPLQYSCLENSMDRGAWQATVHRVTKSQIRLSDYHSLTQLFLYCFSSLLYCEFHEGRLFYYFSIFRESDIVSGTKKIFAELKRVLIRRW